jgi:hypothetical protein
MNLLSSGKTTEEAMEEIDQKVDEMLAEEVPPENPNSPDEKVEFTTSLTEEELTKQVEESLRQSAAAVGIKEADFYALPLGSIVEEISRIRQLQQQILAESALSSSAFTKAPYVPLHVTPPNPGMDEYLEDQRQREMQRFKELAYGHHRTTIPAADMPVWREALRDIREETPVHEVLGTRPHPRSQWWRDEVQVILGATSVRAEARKQTLSILRDLGRDLRELRERLANGEVLKSDSLEPIIEAEYYCLECDHPRSDHKTRPHHELLVCEHRRKSNTCKCRIYASEDEEFFILREGSTAMEERNGILIYTWAWP